MTTSNKESDPMQSEGHDTEQTANCKFMKGILAGSELEDASRSFKAISHPLRLKILCVLGRDELSVQEILSIVGTTQSNVSQHLCLLKDKGIVASRKDANRVYYSVKNETVQKILGSSEQAHLDD